MNVAKLIINIILVILVIFLSYRLFKIINDPIKFEKQKKARREVVIEKLKAIREAERAYKDLKGVYAYNFNDLLASLKNDSFPLVNAIGEVPDTMTEAEAVRKGIIIRDTTLFPLLLQAYKPPDEYIAQPEKYHKELVHLTDSLRTFVEDLPYIPYSGGKKFNIAADQIEKNRVEIPVFEVSASEDLYLAGLNEEFINPGEELKVGSLVEGTDAGNWE